ncbi:MAG TPA: MFS transporter, partial [Rhizomicrobium sp.]|nr:MFS transporter [Rhizomicrobium sp.]
PAMAGTLFQFFTAPFAMLGTSLTYLVSALFLFTVPARELPPEEPHAISRWSRDVADGWRAILVEPMVRPILWMTVLYTLFGAFFGPLYLLYGLKEIGLSPALMGVNIACGGVGALFGATLSNRLSRRFGVGPTIIGCVILYTCFLALVPLAHGPLWLGTTMLMIAQLGGDGFALAFMIPITSLRQAVLPPALLGRTAALFMAVVGGMTVAGALLGGLLGGWIGIRETLALAVAGMAASSLFLLLSPLRILREIPVRHP